MRTVHLPHVAVHFLEVDNISSVEHAVRINWNGYISLVLMRSQQMFDLFTLFINERASLIDLLLQWLELAVLRRIRITKVLQHKDGVRVHIHCIFSHRVHVRNLGLCSPSVIFKFLIELNVIGLDIF